MSGSQISPLTLAMLQAGGAGQASVTDPAVAAALPRLQMAQAMMQQGMSDAPTTRWGAVGRVGQALLGNYLSSTANSGLQDILKQRQLESANILQQMRDGGNPSAPVAQAAPNANSVVPPSFNATYEPGKTNYYSMVRPGESGGSGDTNVKNPVSSAAGPVQATDATWNAFLASPQGAGYTMADRSKEDASKAFTQWNGDTNANTIQSMTGQTPTIGHVVAAHLVGGHGAASLLAHPDDPISKLLTPGAISGNSTILSPNMTGSQAMGAIQNYYGRTANPDGSVQVAGPAAPTDAGAAPQGTPGIQGGQTAQHAMDMIKRANDAIAHTAMDPYNPNNKSIATAAAAQIEYAHTLLQQAQRPQYIQSPNGIQTETVSGKQESAAAPNAHFVQTPTGFVDTTGTHAGTFMPAPRTFQTPSGAGGAVGSGGVVTPIYAADNPGVAARASAGEQGKETGKITAATPQKLVALGQEADTAIGNIDYGVNQLHEAAKGGVNAGYFAPWLSTAAAAGKSLGVDLNALGIKPEAVGNVQSAQKTLGVVAGNILQNTIGKDSAITDAKIEHFIHTQPGIATDPEAIERVLGWARSQFTYNREMAMHGMNNINPETGMLPPGWQSQFYKEKGAFAPIYDPLSGHMEQPKGEGPAPGLPSATPAEAVAPTYHEGQTATGPGGAKMVFQGGHWTPVK